MRDILKENKKKYPKVTIEEQKSDNPRIKKLLKNASKQGKGTGKSEFIITLNEIPDRVPDWVNDISVDESISSQPYHKKKINLDERKWLPFRYMIVNIYSVLK